MSLNASKMPNSSMKIEPLEPATYPARVVQAIDLGLQARPDFQGKEKPPVNMISLTYEFVDEFLKDEDGVDIPEKPRWLSESFPLYSLEAERAKSTARLKALDPDNKTGGDFSELLARACMVTIVHNPNKKTGGVYENVADVGAMRAKDEEKCPDLVNPSRFFDLDAPDLDVFNGLPSFLQEKIKNNLEFEGSLLQEALGDNIPFGETAVGADESGEQDGENPY